MAEKWSLGWRGTPMIVFSFGKGISDLRKHLFVTRGRSGKEWREGVKLVELTRRQLHLRLKKCPIFGIKSTSMVGQRHAICLALGCTQYLSSVIYALCIDQLLSKWSQGKGLHALLETWVYTHAEGRWGLILSTVPREKGGCDPKPGVGVITPCYTFHGAELLLKWQYFCPFPRFGMGVLSLDTVIK